MKYDPSKIKSYLKNTGQNYCFVTVSGAHAYGFPSLDSDLDLRGCHFPSFEESLRYSNKTDTFEEMLETSEYFEHEMDIVSHSLLKYLHLMCRQPNGYILEQINSPLVILTGALHEDLKQLGNLTICKEMKHHYGGFYRNQRTLMTKQSGKEIKLVLYQLRVLASAIYLARTGCLETNLIKTNSELKLYDDKKLQELIEIKTLHEKSNFEDPMLREFWLGVLDNNLGHLDESFDNSDLPHFDSAAISSKALELIKRYIQISYDK